MPGDVGETATPFPGVPDSAATGSGGKRPLRIAVASSGLGHVSRGIEAWADDLATALHARGEDVLLCKGAGPATRPYERVVPCLRREAPATLRLLRDLPRRLAWRVGLGSGYQIEQTTFALNLVRLLRRERVDVLHVQDPLVAVIAQRAQRMSLIRTRTVLAHGTEEPPTFLARIQYLQHSPPGTSNRSGPPGCGSRPGPRSRTSSTRTGSPPAAPTRCGPNWVSPRTR